MENRALQALGWHSLLLLQALEQSYLLVWDALHPMF